MSQKEKWIFPGRAGSKNSKTTTFGRRSGIVYHRIVILFCMTFCLLAGSVFGTEKNQRKVVRVAYQEFNRQMIVDENNTPVSGYAYDYIQTIGAYARWDMNTTICIPRWTTLRSRRVIMHR